MAKKKKATKAKTTKAKTVATAVQSGLAAARKFTTVEFAKEYMKAKDRKVIKNFGSSLAQVERVVELIYDGRQGDEHPELQLFLQSYGKVLSMAAEMNKTIQVMKIRELT